MAKARHNGRVARPPAGHTIATDVIGPLLKTLEEFQLIATFIDGHSRMALVYLLRNRFETEQYMMEAINKISAHFGQPGAKVRCDNANKYTTKLIVKRLGQQAIDGNPTCPHTPEENGVAERYNRTLITRVRATLT
eukprot:IDg23719t1